jgi:hypothetical protein
VLLSRGTEALRERFSDALVRLQHLLFAQPTVLGRQPVLL